MVYPKVRLLSGYDDRCAYARVWRHLQRPPPVCRQVKQCAHRNTHRHTLLTFSRCSFAAARTSTFFDASACARCCSVTLFCSAQAMRGSPTSKGAGGAGGAAAAACDHVDQGRQAEEHMQDAEGVNTVCFGRN